MVKIALADPTAHAVAVAKSKLKSPLCGAFNLSKYS